MKKKYEFKSNISIKTLEIWASNPRFTLKSNVSLSKIYDSVKQDEWMKIEKLLQYEGDFSELKELIEELIKGYDGSIDPILAITNDDKKHFIIEGNRRASVMKILSKDKFKQNFIKYLNGVKNPEPTISDELDINKRRKNLKEILKIINNFTYDNEFENLDIILYSKEISDDEIWKIIYGKHVGESKGKRDWSRLKYFYDLKEEIELIKSRDKNILKDDILTKLSDLWRKNKNIIMKDVDSSIFVTNIIDRYNVHAEKKKKSIIEPTATFHSVSSLELAMSKIKFVDTYDYSRSLNDLFDLKRNIETWNITSKDFEESKVIQLAIFLINSLIKNNKYKEQLYNTRGWKDEYSDDLGEFLTEQLKILDIKFSVNNIRNKYKHNDKVQDFIASVDDAKKSVSKMKKMDLPENLTIFEHAIYRMWTSYVNWIHERLNDTEDKYPHLLMSSLTRSIIENLYYFFTFYSKVDTFAADVKKIDQKNIQKIIDIMNIPFTNLNINLLASNKDLLNDIKNVERNIRPAYEDLGKDRSSLINGLSEEIKKRDWFSENLDIIKNKLNLFNFEAPKYRRYLNDAIHNQFKYAVFTELQQKEHFTAQADLFIQINDLIKCWFSNIK